MLDKLDHQRDPKSKGNDGVYSIDAIEQLAKLHPGSPEWNLSGEHHSVPMNQRQALIDAAKIAVAPISKPLLKGISGDDLLLGKNDLVAALKAFHDRPTNSTPT